MVYVSRRDPVQSFWAKVNVINDDASCWEWTAAVDASGYGKFYVNKNRGHVRASRYSMELITGIVPDQHVLHRCDNPPCVRPDHLWIGTQSDNMRDAVRKGRHYHHVMVGEDHGRSKVTADDVRRIRQLRQSGLSYSDIAAEFGLGVSQVARICKYQTWKHVA